MVYPCNTSVWEVETELKLRVISYKVSYKASLGYIDLDQVAGL